MVVQSNSATAQEGAAASQELSGQAEMLKEKIASFQLAGARKKETPGDRTAFCEKAGTAEPGFSSDKY